MFYTKKAIFVPSKTLDYGSVEHDKKEAKRLSNTLPAVYLQVHPDLMRASCLDGHLCHAELPVECGCCDHGDRSTCADVRLDSGHGHHSLSMVRVTANRYVDGGPQPGVADAHYEIRFTDLEGGEYGSENSTQ